MTYKFGNKWNNYCRDIPIIDYGLKSYLSSKKKTCGFQKVLLPIATYPLKIRTHLSRLTPQKPP